jgi:hypothetical protein
MNSKFVIVFSNSNKIYSDSYRFNKFCLYISSIILRGPLKILRSSFDMLRMTSKFVIFNKKS